MLYINIDYYIVSSLTMVDNY